MAFAIRFVAVAGDAGESVSVLFLLLFLSVSVSVVCFCFCFEARFDWILQ